MSDSIGDGTRQLAGEALLGGNQRFCIIQSLGHGGMGEVYLAEDRNLQRLVVIKAIRADLCKIEELRKRIDRECLLHAKVGPHPHIVTLFDRLVVDAQQFLIMEYVKGETLHELLDRNRRNGKSMPLKDSISIAVQCLDALSHIHRQGIVHRDIKPANLMVAENDGGTLYIKLMDFGIARLSGGNEQSARLTRTDGSSPGTPLYMAPEQIDPRKFGPVSHATDVYALGVMLYQFISGSTPFAGSITEICVAHLTCPPPPLKATSALPESIIRVVMRALEKRPEDRFPTARVFREELLGSAETMGIPRHMLEPRLAAPSSGSVAEDKTLIVPLRTPAPSVGGIAPGQALPPDDVVAVRGVIRCARVVKVAVVVAVILLTGLGIVTWRFFYVEPTPLAPPSFKVVFRYRQPASGDHEIALPTDRVIALSSRDKYAMKVELKEPGWLYVYQKDAIGNVALLFPNPRYDTRSNPVPAGAFLIPSDNDGYVLDNTPGKESIYIAVSRTQCRNWESLYQGYLSDHDQTKAHVLLEQLADLAGRNSTLQHGDRACTVFSFTHTKAAG